MDTLFYCCNCCAMTPTKVIEKNQTFNVKGREITLRAPVRVCNECGEEILDRDLDNNTLNRFYEEYRRLENLLQPDEIKNIRLKYSLSQSSFAKLLGFGEKTITRYENGAIQDVCHDNLIRLMGLLDAFSKLWNERKKCLSEKEQHNVESIINKHKDAFD